MGPSHDDPADGHDDDTSLDSEDALDVDEYEVEDEEPAAHDALLADEDEDDDEDDDGLAPEAGARRPSLLSLLLLVAGAIWIVVALLKIGEPEGNVAPMAISDQAETGALPNIDEDLFSPESGNAIEAKPQPPPEPQNSGENGEFVEDPELAPVVEVGTPASERGPPEGSLLAGKRWPEDYTAPEVVTYVIKRGGSMKIVANLYKIYHHEIEALNPGVSLERELPPSTKIVVYRRKPGIASQSVGYPGDGSLEGGMPMVDGPGRILRHTPWKAWATQTTVATIDLVLREWARRYPDRQPIIVGNLSARSGGRLPPHSSHQSGRDVDLSYPQIWDHKSELAPQVMNERNLDRDLTWKLLVLLRETGAVEVIFIDTILQKLLYKHALETGLFSEKELKNWMEYPSPPGSGSPLIQHVRGHVDHLHVRFKCAPSETRCGSREH